MYTVSSPIYLYKQNPEIVCVCVCVHVYRGKILAFATISSTLVFPALWSPTTTTFGSWSTNLPVLD